MQRQQQVWKRARARYWMVPSGAAPPPPDEVLEIREAWEQVQQALAQLPPAEWQVVVLHYLEDYSCRDIGQLLGMTRDAVKTRLVQVRRRLRGELTGLRESFLAD